jgi:cyanophycinase
MPVHTQTMKLIMKPFELALAMVVASEGGLPAMRAADWPEYGPINGTLVIIGGGSERGAGILETFINRAGGLDAKFVIVPTANGNTAPDGQLKSYKEDEVLAPWKSRGLKNVRMLHTPDRKVADTEEFVKPLRDANAVWFDGDKQQDLIDSYLSTLTHRELIKVLERGGVIGGNAAGATCLGSYLARGPDAGSNSVMFSQPGREPGFAFLRKSVIDLQVNTRNRWDDLIPVIENQPDLLGIGLSESTAIVVKGDRFEVVGKWKVAIHDHTRVYQPWERPYYLLSAGDVFNMKTRKIEKLGDGTQIPPPLNPTAPAPPPKKDPAAG